MLSSLYKFFGKRQPLPNGLQGCVEILAWYHPECVPAQHIVLLIRDAGEKHYLSFSPRVLHGLSERSFCQLREGVDGIFVDNYEDELLIQGFRNAWPNINNDLTEAQQTFIKNNTFKKLSDIEILELTQHFSFNKKAELRQLGEPTEVIELRSLNVEAMINKINLYKTASTPMKWASWSGTFLHKPNTHNCASIVLDVLYTGGLGHLIHSNRDLLTAAGALLGASYALIYNKAYLETLTEIAIQTVQYAVGGLVLGRATGGAMEGYTEIQSFLNLVAIQGKDNIGSVLGLRFGITLLSAVVGLIKQGSIVPSIVTLPREVLNLVYQAKVREEETFSFSTHQLSI